MDKRRKKTLGEWGEMGRRPVTNLVILPSPILQLTLLVFSPFSLPRALGSATCSISKFMDDPQWQSKTETTSLWWHLEAVDDREGEVEVDTPKSAVGIKSHIMLDKYEGRHDF